MPTLPSDARAGLFGKLPARGDFVRENLPRDFTDVWDAWWQRGLGETQHLPRDEWIAAWLEAPVWRFLLPPGLCGRNGVLGIWLPSVDKAGRYSPLTIAATAPGDWAPSVGAMTSFLAAAEQFFCGGVEEDSGQTSRFEQCGIVCLRKSPTPQSHDLDGTAQFVDQRPQGGVLQLAEHSLARLSKNLLNGPLFPSLDAVVQIFKWPSQPTAQGRAHAALPGAHESHQYDGPNPGDRRRLRGLGRPTGSSAHVWRQFAGI